MASGRNEKQRAAQQERERARLYQARVALHDARTRRKRRDNLVAGIVAGVVVLGAVCAQFAYYGVGPGVPTPTPSASASASSDPSLPSATPTDAQ